MSEELEDIANRKRELYEKYGIVVDKNKGGDVYYRGRDFSP